MRFLVPYVTFLILLSVCLAVSYDRTQQIVKEEIKKTNLLALEQAKRTMEIRMSELNNTMWEMLSLASVMRAQYINEPFDGGNSIRFLKASQDLKGMSIQNEFILDYFLLFKRSQLAVNRDKIYTFQELNGLYFRVNGYDYKQWHSLLIESFYQEQYLPAMAITLSDYVHSAIPFVHTLGRKEDSLGSLVILIDNNKVTELLSGLRLSEDSIAYIVNRQGQTISCVTGNHFECSPSASERKLDTTGLILSSTNSSVLGWTFVAVLPKEIVAKQSSDITHSIFQMLLGSLIVGIAAAVWFAYRSSYPLARLVKSLTENGDAQLAARGSTYSWIEETVSRLFERQADIERLHKAQLPLIQNAFSERLLKGGFSSEAEIRTSMAHAGIAMESLSYLVLAVHFPGYGDEANPRILAEIETKKMIVKEALAACWGDKIRIHDAEIYHLAIIYRCSPEEINNKRAIEQRAVQLIAGIYRRSEESVPVLITAGSCCSELLQLPQSYREAIQAFRHQEWEEYCSFIWYDECKMSRTLMFYPQGMESQLFNFTLIGDEERCEGLLRYLYEENVRKRKLSLAMKQQFLNELNGTYIKILAEQNREPAEGEGCIQLATIKEAETYFERLIGKYKELCHLINLDKRSHHSELRDKLIAFIEEHAFDADLSVTKVASVFDISAAYFSQFFKEQTGKNFSFYLEEIRMGRATELLVNRKLSIHEVAVLSGYNSSNTFIRAFKRRFDMTPSEYRQIQTNACM
ncbi:AraC-like DNA-binding protein [Paenibacillus phyllosphaerae]|uniref:AraC-like DNA-binding protein n=2 Tax=Paenibacillus phyllosphaerae TaxID=274593 RepID=A0A7W5B1W4_9BACL|nr:AraC-like DNA-binding protein [Paenibacillus phyllosphaerae]